MQKNLRLSSARTVSRCHDRDRTHRADAFHLGATTGRPPLVSFRCSGARIPCSHPELAHLGSDEPDNSITFVLHPERLLGGHRPELGEGGERFGDEYPHPAAPDYEMKAPVSACWLAMLVANSPSTTCWIRRLSWPRRPACSGTKTRIPSSVPFANGRALLQASGEPLPPNLKPDFLPAMNCSRARARSDAASRQRAAQQSGRRGTRHERDHRQDSAAMKLANKPGRPGAESVEPRKRTEGNTGEQHTCRTQSRESVSQRLVRTRSCPWGFVVHHPR